jgi:hypothetical protein
MPELDVQPVDLLDEHENRATDSSGFLAVGLPKPLAPTSERLEFLFVQPHLRIVTERSAMPQLSASGVALL